MHIIRTVVFWLHLAAGVTAGAIIAVMAATGAMLAFQPQILEWAERPSRQLGPPGPDAPRLGTDDLLARARAARPGMHITALTIAADPTAAVRVSAGGAGVHVDPYTGEVRDLAGQGWRDLFQAAVEWHRYLATDGDRRAIGRAVTGACNAAFLVLALSGLYLWWPRRWTERALRASLWFRRGLTGKARHWNWHNVVGFWCAPVLVVVTLSGMMISYRWVSNLIFRIAGEPPPAAPGPGGAPPVRVPAPPPGARPLALEALLASARQQVPAWKTVTVRFAAGSRGGGESSGRAGGPAALTVSLKATGAWPLFANAQLSLDRFTGKVLRAETYDHYGRGRRLRTWLRFLHTGEALGWPGQLVAGIASLGATVLVVTGLAMAWRRFIRRCRPAATETALASRTFG